MIELKKPLQSIENVSANLICECALSKIQILIKDNVDFDFIINSKETFFYLEKGKLALKNKENSKIISTIDAPAIIGLTRLFTNNEYHYLSSLSDCFLTAFDKENAKLVFDKKNLWQDVSNILSYIINLHYKRERLFSSFSVYGVIRSHLEVLGSLPTNERLNLSLFDFILDRTSISRSSLNKVIKELEIGDYIETKRGILIKINKLPDRF